MTKVINDTKLTQSVLNLFLGKGEITFQEENNAWFDSFDNSLMSNDDAYSLAIKLLDDSLINIETDIKQTSEATPIYRLSCGCCPLCGCTCTEDELDKTRRSLS